MKWQLLTMNLELTTACPLRCPQCYCSLDNGRYLDLDIAKKRVDEAQSIGAKTLNLSGGETMCYPDLYELVEYAAQKMEDVNVAISGVMFDQTAFEQLTAAGIANIHVSLNGSTKEINALSRDGYEYAIEALTLLRDNNYSKTTLNWVMQSSNADDFENMVRLAEEYKVSDLVILGFKPDSNNALNAYPSREQIIRVAEFIKKYKGSVSIRIESCYSNMLAYYLDTKLFGNMNFGRFKGCGAGRYIVSVNVEGKYTPCRHIDYTEDFHTLESYWEGSDFLRQLRQLEDNRREPCSSCYYGDYCRHCQAISWQMHQGLYLGFAECPMYKEKT